MRIIHGDVIYLGNYGTFKQSSTIILSTFLHVLPHCTGSMDEINYFLIIERRLTWQDAEDYCVTHYDGHLAAVTSQDVQDQLAALTRQLGFS